MSHTTQDIFKQTITANMRKRKPENDMRKTNEEIDSLIAGQQEQIGEAAGLVDVKRGHVSKSMGQLVGNRAEAIRALESQKEVTTVNLRSGL